jgi:hypothetical protein
LVTYSSNRRQGFQPLTGLLTQPACLGGEGFELKRGMIN